jgi:hypothetical protein
LPRDLHIGNEAFDAVELQDRVSVEIKKSRFQVNDPYILSVGVFRSQVGKRAGRNAAAAAAVPPVEQEGPSGLETLEEAVDELPEDEDDENLGNAGGTGTGAELEEGVDEGEEVEATA